MSQDTVFRVPENMQRYAFRIHKPDAPRLIVIIPAETKTQAKQIFRESIHASWQVGEIRCLTGSNDAAEIFAALKDAEEQRDNALVMQRAAEGQNRVWANDYAELTVRIEELKDRLRQVEAERVITTHYAVGADFGPVEEHEPISWQDKLAAIWKLVRS